MLSSPPSAFKVPFALLFTRFNVPLFNSTVPNQLSFPVPAEFNVVLPPLIFNVLPPAILTDAPCSISPAFWFKTPFSSVLPTLSFRLK